MSRNEHRRGPGSRPFFSSVLGALGAGLLLASLGVPARGGTGGPPEPAARHVGGQGPDRTAYSAPVVADSGTVTVGEASWTFEVTQCASGPEETRNEAVLFSLAGRGEDGLRVSVSRQMGLGGGIPPERDPEAEPIDNVTVLVGSAAEPEVHWEASSAALQPPFLELDGKEVRATADFVDATSENRRATVKGTLQATCP